MEIFLPVTLWSSSVTLICCASKSDLISFEHKNLILEQENVTNVDEMKITLS